MFHAVNVTGTANVIAAATELGVKKLVYHSSGGVVFDKRDIKNGDESAPYVRKPWTPYLVSRVAADKAVLAANGQHGLMTAVIRPCGIFGDGDEERVKSVYLTWQRGTTHVQIGDNTNLVDCTYVGNVALALLLAADKLPSPDVAGEAFFVSNDAPLPFWTFMHMVWAKLDEELPEQSRAKRGLDKKKTVVIPYFVGLALAYAIQFFAWILRRPAPPMTPYTVVYTTASMYWSIDKARNVLGYKPDVSVEEGIARSVQVRWLEISFSTQLIDVSVAEGGGRHNLHFVLGQGRSIVDCLSSWSSSPHLLL